MSFEVTNLEELVEEPITAIIDAITAFAVEAGMSYVENILSGSDANQAFENVRWGDAGVEAAKAYGLSIFITGVGSTKALAKAANSKLGKIGMEFTGNIVADLMKRYNKGEFTNSDGSFSISKLQKTDLQSIMQGAIVESLVTYGFSGKAAALEKKFGKAKEYMAKQESKLTKSLNNGATKSVIAKRTAKVNNAQKQVLKEMGKAAALSTKTEIVEKGTNIAVDKTVKILSE